MVFDGNTFEVKGKQVFDTYNNQAEANRFMARNIASVLI